MSENNLPDWAVVDAEVIFVSSPTGMSRDTIRKAVITKITPTGQIVTSASELRFKPRDYSEREGWFYRYLSERGWSRGSIRLLPRDHPEVPKMMAERERDHAWNRVQSAIRALEKSKSQEDGYLLGSALTYWQNATRNLENI